MKERGAGASVLGCVRDERAHRVERARRVSGHERGGAVRVATGVDGFERFNEARRERGLRGGEGGHGLQALACDGGFRVVEQAREVVEDGGRALLGVPAGVRRDEEEAARANVSKWAATASVVSLSARRSLSAA